MFSCRYADGAFSLLIGDWDSSASGVLETNTVFIKLIYLDVFMHFELR